MTRARTAPLFPGALALAALLFPVAVRGETLYVTEQLVVNVNSAPDASGERIATVKSGERVEVIEHAGQQIHVRLSGDREGWIRASYLTADEPLRTRLAEREAEIAPLKKEVGELTAQLAAAQAAAATAGPAVPAPAATATTAAPPTVLLSFPGAESPRRVWPWVLGSALLALGIGFALGVLTLDRHIRRKYGGLRIY